MRQLIIAIGNPLRGDDNAAHVAALDAPPEATVYHVVQLTPELASELPGYDEVLFLDADVRVDAVTQQRVESDSLPTGPLSHHCSPQYVVALARRLYRWQGEAWIRSLPAHDFA